MKLQYWLFAAVIILAQARAIAVENTEIETDAFGFRDHPFFIVDQPKKPRHKLDRKGHERLSDRFIRVSIETLPSETVRDQDVVTSESILLTSSTTKPYEVVQQTLPRVHKLPPGHQVAKANYGQNALNVLFVERCNIYILGGQAYEACVVE